MQTDSEYQTDIKMGFKNLINSKKISALFAAFLLMGTGTLFAQAPAANAPAADTGSEWLGVGYYVLLFLLVCVIVAVIGKILKIYELTLKIQGKKGINWNNFIGIICLVFLIAGLYGAYWSFTVQGQEILPEPASAHGVKIDQMFWTTTAITTFVFIITQILLFGFLFKYRGSEKRKAYYYPHNNTIEKIWTIVPAIVLTVLVVFGFFIWRQITNTTEVKGDINIELTAHQFAWEIRYPGADGKLGESDYQRFYTTTNNLAVSPEDKGSYDDLKADTLVLPVGKSIRLNIHAQDVIHSVFMPHFRLQMNAVPGLPTFFKFTPTITTADMRNRLDDPGFNYLLYCNKICGGGHYNMQKVVLVVTPAEYRLWLSHQKPYASDLVKKEWKIAEAGKKVGTGDNKIALNN